MKFSRNQFLKLGLMGTAGMISQPLLAANKASAHSAESLKLGLASYTLRAYTLDETINVAKKLGLKRIALKSMHLPLDSTPANLNAAAEKIRASGLELYGAGVIYMKTEAEVKQAFAYAKNAGIPTIIGVPNHNLLSLAEEEVKSSGIRLAIHNHGPGDNLYSSPDDVYTKIKDLDTRIGLCIDVGHVQRIGQDPAAMIEKYHARLYDIHIKDTDRNDTKGVPVEIGRGVIDIPAIIRVLAKTGYKDIIAIEYEKDEKTPVPGLAESTGYLRGIIRMSRP